MSIEQNPKIVSAKIAGYDAGRLLLKDGVVGINPHSLNDNGDLHRAWMKGYNRALKRLYDCKLTNRSIWVLPRRDWANIDQISGNLIYVSFMGEVKAFHQFTLQEVRLTYCEPF